VVVEQLHIGSYGWRDARWRSDYFPPDMPGEWALAYYAAEFAEVLVPADYWVPEAWPPTARWAEDAQGRLGFHLEVPVALLDTPHWPRFIDAAAALGERLDAVWISVSGAPAERAAEGLRAQLPGLAVVGDPGAAPMPVWRGSDSACPCAPLGLIALDRTPGPRELRALLEGFVACCGPVPAAWLFLQAPPETLRETLTMAQLLGL
jgi:hypothetical protein